MKQSNAETSQSTVFNWLRRQREFLAVIGSAGLILAGCGNADKDDSTAAVVSVPSPSPHESPDATSDSNTNEENIGAESPLITIERASELTGIETLEQAIEINDQRKKYVTENGILNTQIEEGVDVLKTGVEDGNVVAALQEYIKIQGISDTELSAWIEDLVTTIEEWDDNLEFDDDDVRGILTVGVDTPRDHLDTVIKPRLFILALIEWHRIKGDVSMYNGTNCDSPWAILGSAGTETSVETNYCINEVADGRRAYLEGREDFINFEKNLYTAAEVSEAAVEIIYEYQTMDRELDEKTQATFDQDAHAQDW